MIRKIDMREAIDAVVGKNEDGQPKAVVSFQHQIHHGFDESGTPILTVEDQADSLFAYAGIVIGNGKMTTMLTFDNFDDDDYMRFKGLVRDYRQMSMEEYDEKQHILVLTLCDEGSATMFISMLVDSVVFDGVDPIVQFIGDADTARWYALEEDDDEDDGELQFEDLEDFED